eukprot:3311879-Lingulodinium_polyedra.AAC.1
MLGSRGPPALRPPPLITFGKSSEGRLVALSLWSATEFPGSRPVCRTFTPTRALSRRRTPCSFTG